MSHGLNPEQKSAVDTLAGPMLVLAGAGSGKTRVVTFRIANLIRSGIPPNRILAVTFTNKAAREMRERITSMLGTKRRSRRSRNGAEPREDIPVIGTFHAHCVQILRRHATQLGYPARFAIYDRGDQESVARDVLRTLHVHSGMLKPGDLLSHVSRWKNAGVAADSALDHARTDAEHVAASAYRRYQQAIKLAGAMDFDDLLLMTEKLLREFHEVREQEAGRFDHILVDEYQDTNQSQYEIIRSLAGQHRNLCVVGDDDQSIYGFRGAEIRHILNFKADWAEAKQVRLESNYRSTAPILEMANRLISFNKTRHDKILRPARMGGRPPRILQFKTETEEAENISQEIRRILDRGVRQPADIAILFRTNEQPRVFETQLRKAKVPYSLIGSQSFFDRREVKDLLCYLKIIDNPRDEVSLLRIINVPQRGIGAKSVEVLLQKAVAAGTSVWQICEQGTLLSTLPTAAQKGISSLQELVRRAREDLLSETPQLSSGVQRLIDGLDFLSNLTRLYPNPEEAEARRASVQEFLNAMAEFEASNDNPTLAGFLDEVALAGKEFSSGKDKKQGNAVSLMTYHSSKGLEFPIVYMVGMEEGVLPHRRSLAENFADVEEERRLCYVGITRAEDELTLSLPLSRMKWGKARPTFVSRFLYEMTNQTDNPNRLKAIQAARKEINYSKRAAAKKSSSKRGGRPTSKAQRP